MPSIKERMAALASAAGAPPPQHENLWRRGSTKASASTTPP